MNKYIIIILALCFQNCSKSELGDPCPDLPLPSEGSGPDPTNPEALTSNGLQVVGYDVNYPCDSTICVRTLGLDPMCSKECNSDDECDLGFVCDNVVSLGQFANRKFCVTQQCEQDSDCGDPWEFRCNPVSQVDEEGNLVKYCQKVP